MSARAFVTSAPLKRASDHLVHGGALPALLVGALLAGCGVAGSQTATPTAGASSAAVTPSAAATPSPTASAQASDAQPAAKLVKAGFGQRDQYVWVTSIVQAVGDDAVGKFITVQFNVLDRSGKILASIDQVEALTSKGQKIALGTQVDLPSAKVKAAKVEATLAVGNDTGDPPGDFNVTATPATVGKDEYGGLTATFQLINSGSGRVKDARVGVVCMNKAGDIVGGTSDYPDLIPPHGKIRVDAPLTTTGTPATCEVYPGPGL